MQTYFNTSLANMDILFCLLSSHLWGGSPGKGLAECEAEPDEKAALAGRGAAAPERSLKKIYLNKGNV